MYSDEVMKLSKSMSEELRALRREFHQFPELSFKEFETARKIAIYMKELGYEVKENVGKTGVVALLKGAKENPTVALRADMDALPVKEMTGLSYASKNDGVMHACGHDIHVTCALGAAKILASLKDELQGSVKFIFQPAEEINAGAKAMIDDGVLEDPPVSFIFGLHNNPEIPVGKVGLKEGPLMAAVDSTFINVRGQGGHAAYPHRVIDPIVCASSIVMNLQTIVSRNVDPQKAAVISFGSINGGIANNVIPDEVKLTGTVRTFDEGLRDSIEGWMKRTVENTASSLGCKVEFNYRRDLPPVVNHPEATKIALWAAQKVFGEDGIILPTPSMGGEDFALYQKKVPGCYFWLGVGNPDIDAIHPWHSPHFKADEDALWRGAALFSVSAIIALEELTKNSQ
ncbi:MAG: M20 family metallopeptidase [Acetomicrobium sp.]